jgi:hypothetical protein
MSSLIASRPSSLMVVAVFVLAAACGGGNPAGPSGSSGSGSGSGGSGGSGGTGGASGGRTISALIDGVPFNAAASGTRSGNPALLLVAGSTVAGATGSTLGFGAPLAVGTHAIAVGSGLNANLTILNGTAVASGYLAFQTSGSGSVTIATLTATGATGTFNFVMTSTTGGAPKTVTNGTFDVTF